METKEFTERPNKFNNLAVIGADSDSGIAWVARFKMNRFRVDGFHMADLNCDQDESISRAGEMLRGVTQWRIKDREMHVLIHLSTLDHLWSSYFCNFIGYSGGRRIVSTCGPFGEEGSKGEFKLEPVDPMIRLYQTDGTIFERLRESPVDKSVERTVPFAETWDWYEAMSVVHLYNENSYVLKKETSGRPIVCF